MVVPGQESSCEVVVEGQLKVRNLLVDLGA